MAQRVTQVEHVFDLCPMRHWAATTMRRRRTVTDVAAAGPDRTAALRGDCARCSGLCCVALAFARSVDFALDKDAGDPCPNLQEDFRCAIHPVLAQRGFPGCTVFDCLGAGQKVTQVTFGGRTWRDDAGSRDQVFAAFAVMRRLHELLWFLEQARTVPQAGPLRGQVEQLLDETERLTDRAAEDLLALDVDAHRARVGAVLSRVSELVRGDVPSRRRPGAQSRQVGRGRRGVGPEADLVGADLAGRDLAGRDLRRADLRGADLRGALLIAADLRRADLRRADLVGADLRGADLGGADLSEALFLTQPQTEAARGDAATRLPAGLRRPAAWTRRPAQP
jgi:hypothetical protein